MIHGDCFRAALFLLFASGAYAQTISFLPPFSTSNAYSPVWVTTDAGGFYEVHRSDSGTSGVVTLRRLDSGGSEQWTREVTAANPAAIPLGVVADATGIYVVGRLDSQTTFLRKYDAAGNDLWTRQIGASLQDAATGSMSVDGTGIYVTGLTWDIATSRGGVTLRKYDTNGNELWTRQAGPSRSNIAVAAANATGVYLFAASDTDEPFVRKYEIGGNEVWTKRFGKTGLVLGAAADDTGIYAVGFLCCDGASFVRKYDARGNEVWTRPIGDEPPRAVTADATGVYVVGATRHALPGQCYGGGSDAFARKYDAGGNEIWTREFGTWATESALGVAVDASSVYVIVSRNGYVYPDRREAGTLVAKLEKYPAPAALDSRPRIFQECILNDASHLGGAVAPGEIVSILGSGLGPLASTEAVITEGGRLDTTLAGTRVLFDGLPAPLISVSDGRSSAVVPYEVAGQRSVDVQVEYQGILSDPVTVPVLDKHLGIYTADRSGGGQAAVVNEDGTINSPAHPAPRGTVVSIYATGGGQTDPPGEDGAIVENPAKLKSEIGLVVLTDNLEQEFCGGPVGLICGEVLFTGTVPVSVSGLVQIDARIPLNTPPGNAVPLHVGFTEQSITIAIR